MPLLLIPLLPLVLLAAWALLLPLSLWLRYRVGKSRQRAVGWIVAANAWALAVSAILFLLGAWIGGHWVADALRDACLGLLAGIALGIAGLWSSRFESHPDGLYYTPNHGLALLLTALVAGRMFGDWAIPLIAAAAALKATGTLGGWMLVTGESGARAAQRSFLPAIFGRLRANGSAGWGLFIIALSMSAIAFVTVSPTVSGQFTTIINMVVSLVVMAYIAAGLSLLFGTRERPATAGDRTLGMLALIACGLLISSTDNDILVGSLVIALLAWAAYRGFGRRRASPA